MPRILAIGDIHGCSTALDALLQFVRPAADDRIITLGDYVDRGPDSRGVLDRLVELYRSGQLIPLRGNHEVMMLAAEDSNSAFEFWTAVGGREALDSYSTDSLVDIPTSHWHFVKNQCLDWHESDRHIFVHASLVYDLPMDEQPTEILMWEPISERTRRHQSGKTMVCGHTEQRGGWPIVLPGIIGLDTWCYGDGWLTCLDVASGRIWQANQAGQTRSGYLDVR
jgi:serine/threonine protein phosphatase 1